MGSGIFKFIVVHLPIPILHSLWFSFFIHFSLLVASAAVFEGENGGRGSDAGIISSTSSLSSLSEIVAPPPQSEPFLKTKGSPFRPSIAVIVGVLTMVVSITFLILLYAKHCRGGDTLNPFSSNRGYPPPTTARKNSGIDRAVIDSLPIFRFASLRGQKDGLECAVCLNRFESTEVLRLLPKCKHAFHVECVDTWLDAHSTCPLCRYRVDPEDILLVEDHRILRRSCSNIGETPPSRSSFGQQPTPDLRAAVSKVSGRHSFAGNTLEVIVETPKSAGLVPRRSLDSWSSRKNKRQINSSSSSGGKSSEIVEVGCFDRPRKDELLLGNDDDGDDKTLINNNNNNKGKDVAPEQQRRLEHRIIISAEDGLHRRWSDVQPSDLLYLQSEMILSDSRRFSASRTFRPSMSTRSSVEGSTSSSNYNNSWSGKNVINTRSVSEITGLSRFRSNDQEVVVRDDHHHGGGGDGGGEEQQKTGKWDYRKRQELGGAMSRWMAWISQSNSDRQQSPQQPSHSPAVHGTFTPPAGSSPSSPVVF